MRGILFEGGPNAGWVFLLVTIVLGGAAALATGRAIARTWRTFAQAPFAMFALAAAVCFLHYALFAESAIPLGKLGAALSLARTDAAGGLAALLASLHYLFVTFVILLTIAWAGFRFTRARQMETQYPWAMRRLGPFGWALREPSATEIRPN